MYWIINDKGNDIHINVPAVEIEKLIPNNKKEKDKEGSEDILKRVLKARHVQLKRFTKTPGVYTNSNMKNKHIKEFCKLPPESHLVLKQAVNNYNLSARTYFRLIKISQTIADLSESETIRPEHVAEALQYRIRVES